MVSLDKSYRLAQNVPWAQKQWSRLRKRRSTTDQRGASAAFCHIHIAAVNWHVPNTRNCIYQKLYHLDMWIKFTSSKGGDTQSRNLYKKLVQVDLYKKLDHLTWFLVQDFSCTSFLHRIQHSSIPHKKLACTWLEWWALIGRLPIAAMFHFVVLMLLTICATKLIYCVFRFIFNLI